MAREDLLKQLEAELADAEAYAASLRVAVDAVKGKVTPVSQAGTGAPPRPQRTTGAPSTAPLLLSIIDESEREWNTRDLTDEMFQRGWETTSPNPRQAVKATAARLVKAGKLRRVSEGVYASSIVRRLL